MYAEWWIDVITKVTSKLSDFYHLIMLSWPVEAQIAHLLPSCNFLFLSLYLLCFLFHFLNRYMRVLFFHNCLWLLLLDTFSMQAAEGGVFRLGGIPSLQLFNIYSYSLFLIFWPAFPSTRCLLLQDFSPKTPPTCPVPFVSLINIKSSPTRLTIPVKNQNNWWLFDWP